MWDLEGTLLIENRSGAPNRAHRAFDGLRGRRPIYLDRVALGFPELVIFGGHIGLHGEAPLGPGCFSQFRPSSESSLHPPLVT